MSDPYWFLREIPEPKPWCSTGDCVELRDVDGSLMSRGIVTNVSQHDGPGRFTYDLLADPHPDL